MKQTLTLILSTLLIAQTVHAQTVTTNPENWTTLIPSNSCTGCTITIPTGYTLVLNSGAGSCDGCTFTGGGTVTVSAGFKFPNNTTAFNNLTVIFNSSPGSLKNINFSNDSIAINAALTYSSGPTTVTNSRISVNAALKFQTATISGDTVHLNSTMSFSSSTDNIQNSHFDMAAGSSLSMQDAATSGSVFSMVGSAGFSTNNLTSSADAFYMAGSSTMKNSGTATFTNDVFSLSNTAGFSNSSGVTMSGGSITTNDNSTFKVSSAFASTNTNMTFNDNSAFSASSGVSVTGGQVTLNGSASLKSSSSADFEGAIVNLNGNTALNVSSTLKLGGGTDLTIGDNTGTSTADVTTSGLTVIGNSFIGVANGGNSIKVSSGSFTNDHGSVTIGSGAIKGCNTFSNSGSNTCVVLAIANLSLTITHGDDGKPALSWTDDQTATPADHYLVQRNTGDLDWTTIATIDAANTAQANFHYSDVDAPAGTIDYRIARVDAGGKTLYSSVSAITLAEAHSAGTVGLYPNPVMGGTFYVTTANPGRLVINIYTMTGQLLFHTEGNGQTQYPVRLPSQTSGAVIVQTIQQGITRSFTLLVR